MRLILKRFCGRAASPKPLHDGIIEQLSRIDEWEASVSDLQETYGASHTLRLVRAAIFLLRTTCHTAIHQTDDALERYISHVTFQCFAFGLTSHHVCVWQCDRFCAALVGTHATIPDCLLH